LSDQRPEVVVFGVGGAGVNAVSRLMDVGLRGVRFVAADTSRQTLERAPGARCIALDGSGPGTGLGAGGDLRYGSNAARRAWRRLREAMDGADIVFVVAGLAGGTGGGAGPEVARIARSTGALTLGFGIEPFGFECADRIDAAEAARRALADACDSYIRVDNRRTIELAGDALSLDVALRVADDVVRQAVQGLTELVSDCGWINVDLATVRMQLRDAGEGCLALGIGRGKEPVRAAVAAALSSPLADMSGIEHAQSVLVQITGGPGLQIADTAEAADDLRSRLDRDCQMVVGVACDPMLADAVQVTILGAGIERAPDSLRRAAVRAASRMAQDAARAAADLEAERVAAQEAARLRAERRRIAASRGFRFNTTAPAAREVPVRAAAGVLACLNIDFDMLEPEPMIAQAV